MASSIGRSIDPLLQPFKLRHVTLKNRIFSTSHCPAYVVDGFPQERYRLYHEAKAAGGIGMTMFGGSSNVEVDSPSVFGQIDISKDAIIPHLQALADGIHKHGSVTMCQLTHMGFRSSWDCGTWIPTISPSYTREPVHRTFCREMDIHDIDRVRRAFRSAARRCKEGNLDGVEIMCAGHLLDQFWSHNWNKRTDEYGGSIDNRMRLVREVLEEVRDDVGEDIIVGLRVIVNDMQPDGYGRDGEEICLKLCESGLVDYLNVNFGDIARRVSLAEHIPPMCTKIGPRLDMVKNFRDLLVENGFGHIPLLHACRVSEVASARAAIKEGTLDLVGMTRAHIADPNIVNKIAAGKEHTIRPCVGAGYCIDRIYFGKDAFCLHNPASGREKIIPQVISPSSEPGKKVVVVGGGPGGLEAARVCSERGHNVVLFEAASKLGGQVLVAQKGSWKRDLIGITTWLEERLLDNPNVKIVTGTLAMSDDILDENPDFVVIATGGLPNIDAFGLGSENVVSTWDVLTGQVEVKKGMDVLVYDDLSREQAVSCAEFLTANGANVEIVTPEQKLMVELGSTNYPIHLAQLKKGGVKISTDLRLYEVERRNSSGQLTAHFQHEYAYTKETKEAEMIVVEHGTKPSTELFEDLRGYSCNDGVMDTTAWERGYPGDESNIFRIRDTGFVLFRVGDAVSSRNIHAAIHDSIRICKDF